MKLISKLKVLEEKNAKAFPWEDSDILFKCDHCHNEFWLPQVSKDALDSLEKDADYRHPDLTRTQWNCFSTGLCPKCHRDVKEDN